MSEDEIIEKALQIINARYLMQSVCFSEPAARRNFFSLNLYSLEREALMAVALDAELRVLKHEILFWGTNKDVHADVGEICKFALRNHAHFMVVAHNHPGGSGAYPSEPDAAMTVKTYQALQLLGIRLLDSIVMARANGFSMADARMIPFGSIPWTPQKVPAR